MNSSNSWETSKLARSCCVDNQQRDVGKVREGTNVRHKRRIELFRLHLVPIKWGEPTMAPDLLRVRDARSATQSLLGVSLEKLWSNHISKEKAKPVNDHSRLTPKMAEVHSPLTGPWRCEGFLIGCVKILSRILSAELPSKGRRCQSSSKAQTPKLHQSTWKEYPGRCGSTTSGAMYAMEPETEVCRRCWE